MNDKKSRKVAGKAQVLPDWIVPNGGNGGVEIEPWAVHHAPRLAPDELGLMVRLALVLAHRPGIALADAVEIAAHENENDAETLRRALGRCEP